MFVAGRGSCGCPLGSFLLSFKTAVLSMLWDKKERLNENTLKNEEERQSKKARREVTQLLDEKELPDKKQLMKEQKRLNEKRNCWTRRSHGTRSPRPLEACLLGVPFSRCS